MSNTTRSPRHDLSFFIHADELQTRHVRGQAPPAVITMKAGKRVGDHTVGGSKSKRNRQWKQIAKRRASKRRRQEALCVE